MLHREARWPPPTARLLSGPLRLESKHSQSAAQLHPREPLSFCYSHRYPQASYGPAQALSSMALRYLCRVGRHH